MVMGSAAGGRAGIVLAGGRSTRFGDREKALATLGGRPLLWHVVARLGTVVDSVVVNCRRDQRAAFRAAVTTTDTDVAFAVDPDPGQGPAAGLSTALNAVGEPVVAVTACDMPFIDPAFFAWLCDRRADAGCAGAVPVVDGHPQVTHSVLAAAPTRVAVDAAAAAGNRSLSGVVARLPVTQVPAAQTRHRTARHSFMDVDTPAELAAARERHRAPRAVDRAHDSGETGVSNAGD
ncbi:molybdenum cofactor guanylyltransferase [Halobacterium salinarum]|uniref:molybdenum cofactor guanylyltransferase n=1 Tax=Halobacterium salinarum TaxID=2242 RepID=UPI0025526C90|nr:molybdenum cofactor guanylyltransferase [Halobacterium salinarum]MDL0130714.1 molybdenum cofactor guanylyltransferase [Halobacterium salinarum]